ncbi:MAG: hypothetical protein VKL39_04410 [Leptolyngbyaceae bacterium]|nr:hypothetical protein [Leptolyngbyaceae bacterium]
MLYQDRLKKWAIVRMSSGQKPVILERFRSAADAEGHLKVLKKQRPQESLMVIFDRPSTPDPADDPVSEAVSAPDASGAGS